MNPLTFKTEFDITSYITPTDGDLAMIESIIVYILPKKLT